MNPATAVRPFLVAAKELVFSVGTQHMRPVCGDPIEVSAQRQQVIQDLPVKRQIPVPEHGPKNTLPTLTPAGAGKLISQLEQSPEQNNQW